MNKRKISFFILTLVILLVLYLTLKDDFNGILNSILKSNKYILIFGMLLFMLYLFLKSISLMLFIKERNSNYSIKKAYDLTLIAQLLNGITPFQTGGQPFQIYLLKKEGIKVSDSTNALIKDFISYQISLILTALLALILNAIFHTITLNNAITILTISGFVVNLIVLFILIVIITAKESGKKIISKIINFVYRFKIINKHFDKKQTIESLNSFYDTGDEIRNNKINFIVAIIINFFALIVLYLLPYIIISAMSSSISLIQSFVATSFVMLIGNFVPIPGATGGIEYAFIKLFSNFIHNPILSGVMILWRFITYVFAMIIGFAVLVLKMNTSYKLYNLSRKEE